MSNRHFLGPYHWTDDEADNCARMYGTTLLNFAAFESLSTPLRVLGSIGSLRSWRMT